MIHLARFGLVLAAAGALALVPAEAQPFHFQAHPAAFQGGGGQRGDFGARRSFRGPGPHAGDWLRRYKDLPPDQQQKALESDPQFQQLPPERQQKLKQRLQKFSSLPPEKQQQILDRMETWEHLAPEQQRRAMTLFDHVRNMPENRRKMLMKAYHEMREMSPEEQQRTLQSEQMRSLFSDEERDTLKGFLDLGVGPGRRSSQPEGTPAPPQ